MGVKAEHDGEEDGPKADAHGDGVKVEDGASVAAEGGMKVEEESGLKRPAQRDIGEAAASSSEANKRARLAVEASPQIYHLDDDTNEGVGIVCWTWDESCNSLWRRGHMLQR